LRQCTQIVGIATDLVAVISKISEKVVV
jgi:hypothetical protein